MTLSSPSAIPFALVDVFTQVPLAGNPLAVVPDAEGLPETVLIRLAREFNQSETTFIYPPTLPGADWRLRSFTPAGVEVYGAGHNALGAWWWLAATGHLGALEPVATFRQQLGPDMLPLTIQSEAGQLRSIGMQQSPPSFGSEAVDRTALADALGLSTSDVLTDYPAQVVSTGVDHLLVPVQQQALDRVSPKPEVLAALVLEQGGEGCYVFGLEPQEAGATADARFFNPGVGIAEDPATGTAAGPLAAYLRAYGLATAPDIVIVQGRATGRLSRLHLVLSGDEVTLWGDAVISAEGLVRID